MKYELLSLSEGETDSRCICGNARSFERPLMSRSPLKSENRQMEILSDVSASSPSSGDGATFKPTEEGFDEEAGQFVAAERWALEWDLYGIVQACRHPRIS